MPRASARMREPRAQTCAASALTGNSGAIARDTGALTLDGCRLHSTGAFREEIAFTSRVLTRCSSDSPPGIAGSHCEAAPPRHRR
jgi:hypothetical protein